MTFVIIGMQIYNLILIFADIFLPQLYSIFFSTNRVDHLMSIQITIINRRFIMNSFKHLRRVLTIALLSVFAAIIFSCSSSTGSEEDSATQYSKTETFDNTRNGARLILSYDAQSNSFTGSVENTTTKTLKKVRVEVHLSNGAELGPTTPTDLGPGATMDITLPALNASFDTWSAHPEVG